MNICTTVKKYSIQVREYAPGMNHHRTDKFNVREVIKRKPQAQQIGNFNPLFCQYKGRRVLIHSDEGDLSDPFRREESYAKRFFIEVWSEGGKS